MIKELTVLIPTHNREKLLNRAIDSLYKQDENIKINCVIADNFSQDNTSEVIEKWSKSRKNLNIKYLKHKELIKPFENWKSLIPYINTEYSKFLFDDDWLESYALSTMLKTLLNFKADSLIFNTNIYAKINEFKSLNSYYKNPTSKLSENMVIDSTLRLQNPYPITPSAAIQTSDVLIESMKFSEINQQCTESVIGNDLIMNFFPIFLRRNSYFVDKSIVNLWGGDDSVTINTSNGRYLSFCYLKSLIYLIDKFDFETSDIQKNLINHKISLNNFRSIFNKEFDKFSNSKQFEAKMSLSEIIRKINNF